MNRYLVTLACGFACACAGSRGDASHRRLDVRGRHLRVLSQHPGISRREDDQVRGSVTVVGDSLYVQPDSGCAVYRPMNATQKPMPGIVSLTCGEAGLTFDRRNLKSARWFTYVQVPKQRNVCVQYEPRDAARSPRCLRSRPETYYERQQRSGAVQIKPMQ